MLRQTRAQIGLKSCNSIPLRRFDFKKCQCLKIKFKLKHIDIYVLIKKYLPNSKVNCVNICIQRLQFRLQLLEFSVNKRFK